MAQRSPSFTYAEYRAVDDASDLKHEYVNGQIVAMSGGPLTNPTALVEVLSKTTEQSDRGENAACQPKAGPREHEKFAHYQRLPSLQHYVLVSQTERRAEVFTRGAGHGWEYHAVEAGLVKLPAIGVSLDLEALYADPLVARGLGVPEV